MRINRELCIGCGDCLLYCPVDAILMKEETAIIDTALCLDCGACIRAGCPVNAIENTLEENRAQSIAKDFSDPMRYHETKIPGRGTEEVKTNDVTGVVKKGEVGVLIEMGRPCLGSSMKDIETITKSLSPLGIMYEPNNPLIRLMEDPGKGTFPADLLGMKIVSAIIQFSIPLKNLKTVLETLMKCQEKIETVFSLSVISRLHSNMQIPKELVAGLSEMGLTYRPNAKINLGLGRPLAKD